jgi:glycosyltransferase involved in cell wall biosynthesis
LTAIEAKLKPTPASRLSTKVSHDNLGMRAAINAAVKIAEGEFIMKIDEHCMVGQGYDRILAETCQADWVVIPRRKRLDPETWTLIERRPPRH